MEIDSDWQERTKLLIGDDFKKIEKSNIIIFGLGGVGGIVAEMLCRAGISKMTIIDGDTIHLSNLNRQIFTDLNLIGQNKAEVISKKLLAINSNIRLKVINKYITEEQMLNILNAENYDYVVDAIDTISPKISLLYNSVQLSYRIISSMGAGGKLNPSLVRVDDLSNTVDCRLARLVRKRLHRMGIYEGIKVVFSPEKINKDSVKIVDLPNKKSTLGTISYLPAIFGIYITWTIIDDLLK